MVRKKQPSFSRTVSIFFSILLVVVGFLTPYLAKQNFPSPGVKQETSEPAATIPAGKGFSWSPRDGETLTIPTYDGSASVVLRNNVPEFEDADFHNRSYKEFSELDPLGRGGPAIAQVGPDLMPTEPRGKIGMVKPSGWHTIRYDDLIKDKYLYNRCHLIGYQLCGENANEKNLITGTRYLNVTGMEPYENQVAEYVEDTGHPVLYRVTPVFLDDELVARGVLMEAESVKDHGKSLHFCVYCYNVQPGISIDYETGNSARVKK